MDAFRREVLVEIVEALQQNLGGEIDLVSEETYPPGKYSLLEG